jgi:hypothetical protein
MGKRERSSKFHVGSKYRTLPANFHLFAPAILNLPPADGPVDEPAEMSRVEFPRRAVLTGLRRATSNLPAGAHFFIGPLFKGPQKEHLPLDVHRDSSPPLFEALNAPERRSQELRDFLLSFFKFLTKRLEFFGVHGFLLEGQKKFLSRMKFFLDSIYHTVLEKQTILNFSFPVATDLPKKSYSKISSGGKSV